MVIDFELNETQKELQKLASDFARKEILPQAEHHDKESKFPLEIAQKAFEVGLMNPGFPEYVGGLDLGILEECIIAEELGAACTGIATALGANMLASAPLIAVDNHEINKEFLAPMM